MKPNIILINCDDLGYGDLGCYGSTVNDTPAVDRLASEGIKLTGFRMASPVCTPSRGAMLTGCYPNRIGFDQFDGKGVLFPGMAQGLNPDETTIARMLKGVGYRTALVGKWHCGDQPEFLPTRHGFDEWHGLPYSNDMGLNIWVKTYPPLPLMEGEQVVQEQPDQRSLTERYVVRAQQFMRDNANRPFFLYFAHFQPHEPLYATEPFIEKSRNGLYGAAVGQVDWALAALLDELKRLGLEENTLVIFTSDNGAKYGKGGSNNPLRGAKGSQWEGGFRVPCIMRWPGKIPAGIQSDTLTTSMDFLPTLAAITGAKLPERPIDGRDALAVWKGQTTETPYETFAYYRQDELRAICDARYKLILVESKESRAGELYDLKNDVSETTDIAAAHPDVVARLQAAAKGFRESLGDKGRPGRDVRPHGKVDNPRTITHRDENKPFIIMEYY